MSLPLKIQAVRYGAKLDRFLLSTFSLDEVMIMIEHGIFNQSLFDHFAPALNWRRIAEKVAMPQTMLRRYDMYLDWTAVSQYQQLDEEFIGIYESQVNWENISRYQQLSPAFVLTNPVNLTLCFSSPQLKWDSGDFTSFLLFWGDTICRVQNLTESYIKKHAARMIWGALSQAKRTWSDEFLRANITRFDRTLLLQNAILTERQLEELFLPDPRISIYQVLSHDFIERHFNQLDGGGLVAKQTLSDVQLGRIQNVDKIWISANLKNLLDVGRMASLCDWPTLSAREDIPESILVENKTKVVWSRVCVKFPSDTFLTLVHDKLSPLYVTVNASEQFLISHPHFITEEVRDNKRIISMKFFDKYFDVFGARHLATTRYLSTHFINKHWAQLDWNLLIKHQNLTREQRMRMIR